MTGASLSPKTYPKLLPHRLLPNPRKNWGNNLDYVCFDTSHKQFYVPAIFFLSLTDSLHQAILTALSMITGYCLACSIFCTLRTGLQTGSLASILKDASAVQNTTLSHPSIHCVMDVFESDYYVFQTLRYAEVFGDAGVQASLDYLKRDKKVSASNFLL